MSNWPLGIISSAQSSGYIIEGSGLFDGANGSYLKRTLGSSGNTTQSTIHLVHKVVGLGTNRYLWSSGNDAGGDTANYASIRFDTSDRIEVDMRISTANVLFFVTTRVFRDPASFMSIGVVFDIQNGTAADRLRIYINGVRETVFTTATNLLDGSDVSV